MRIKYGRSLAFWWREFKAAVLGSRSARSCRNIRRAHCALLRSFWSRRGRILSFVFTATPGAGGFHYGGRASTLLDQCSKETISVAIYIVTAGFLSLSRRSVRLLSLDSWPESGQAALVNTTHGQCDGKSSHVVNAQTQ